MTFEATAPAKIILFGEHAVVYGQPAIAIPVTSLRARVYAEPTTPQTGVTIHSPNTRQVITVDLLDPDPQSSLAYAVQLVCQKFGITDLPDYALHINSSIPLGRGLGSGAAVGTALVKVLLQIFEKTLPLAELNQLIFEVEKKHHGTPSGIDNTVIVYEQPVYFVKGEPIRTFKIGRSLSLLIGDTGYGTSTHITVGDVRRLYELDAEHYMTIFNRIGKITRDARRCIERGDAFRLGRLMNENHDLLQRLTVSSIELDFLCEMAVEAGAYGAKLSGGGRGGNMIALVADNVVDDVMKAMYSAGAQQVVKTRILPQQD